MSVMLDLSARFLLDFSVKKKNKIFIHTSFCVIKLPFHIEFNYAGCANNDFFKKKNSYKKNL